MNKYSRVLSGSILAALAVSLGFTSAAAHDMSKMKGMGTRPSGAFQSEMDGSMAAMDRAMMSAPMTGKPDHDFAAMMVPHHQGAIDMARIELQYGTNPVLRRLAQEIIVTQQQEVIVMKQQMAQSAIQATSIVFAKASGRAKIAMPGKAELGQSAHLRSTSFSLDLGPASIKADPGKPTPISSRDRVYTGDQTSNTVSVIDPSTNTLLGVIKLGDAVPQAIQPLYRGQLLVHGLGFSPDHKTLAAISIGSNSVTLIDTATNTVKGTVYVGRSPHEGFFTPSGKELWVVVRGEDYISVIDPVKMKETRRIQTANGPGMVLFSPDGRYAYVPSSFTPELDVVETRSGHVIARVPQASPFSPNLAVSPDGTQVWFTLKDSGKTQVISAQPPFKTLTTIETGPITNHVTMIDNTSGSFAYVTVGGLNEVKVFSRQAPFNQVATIAMGELPHGIWGSGDGTRAYVGLENGDAVQAIDTLTNTVTATIPIGQLPQAVVYVPNAVPDGSPDTSNLMPLGQASQALHLTLDPPAGSSGKGHASVVVNSLGLVDNLQIAATGLTPGKEYQLALVESRTAPYGSRVGLANLKANASGAQIAQTIGPLRDVVTDAATAAKPSPQHYLMLFPSGSNDPILVQQP